MGYPRRVAFNVLPPPVARSGLAEPLATWPTGGGPAMIHPARSHSQYLEFVQTRREHLAVKVPHDATPLWCKFRHTDLSAAYPILARLYTPDRGRPAHRPDDMLRSWLLMLECHITSVAVWVHRLHEQPFYALLSGFDPEALPGVGTFYDFQDRLPLSSPGSPPACWCAPPPRPTTVSGRSTCPACPRINAASRKCSTPSLCPPRSPRA